MMSLVQTKLRVVIPIKWAFEAAYYKSRNTGTRNDGTPAERRNNGGTTERGTPAE